MKNKFFTPEYINRSRWDSYWAQIDSVLKTEPENVLEIGGGSGLVSFTLKNFGIDVKTMDIDPAVSPEVTGDVRKIPFEDGSFDTVLCSQVLEHLPFSDFPRAVKEIARVARKFVVISLPEPYGTYFYIGFKLLPFFPKIELTRKFNFFLPKLEENSPHYWEVGRSGSSFAEVVKVLNRNRLIMEKSFCPKENLYHHFFILKKI